MQIHTQQTQDDILYGLLFRIFAEGTMPHAHCQVHQAASVCVASACVSLCYGEGPLSAVCWREGRSSLWQCQHSTPPDSANVSAPSCQGSALLFQSAAPSVALQWRSCSLLFTPFQSHTLSLWQEEHFCSILVLWRHGSQCWPDLSTSWTLATTEREPSWIIGRDTNVVFFFLTSQGKNVYLMCGKPHLFFWNGIFFHLAVILYLELLV